MSDITVIGLGDMGSALARTFLNAGRTVTIWNRSPEKAAALVAAGAELVDSAASAASVSPRTVMCVSDYQAAGEILRSPGTTDALKGKTLIQLGNGTPKEARASSAWAGANGVDYLDGTILAWPSQIGAVDTAILVSGPAATFFSVEADLKILAGGLAHTGEAVGEASAVAAAILTYIAAEWVGFCHAALILQAEGLRVDNFGALIDAITPILGAEALRMGRVLQNEEFGSPESTLKTSGSDVIRLVRQAKEAGINDEIPTFLAGLFNRAINAGLGDEEHVALIKVLR